MRLLIPQFIVLWGSWLLAYCAKNDVVISFLTVLQLQGSKNVIETMKLYYERNTTNIYSIIQFNTISKNLKIYNFIRRIIPKYSPFHNFKE